MPRQLSGAVTSALAGPVIRPVLLVELDFPSGVMRLANARGDVSWQGETFAGDGRFLDFDEIEETIDLRPTVARLTFAAADAADPLYLALRDDAYQGRSARLWLLLLDAAGAVIGAVDDPFYAGRMDAPEWDETPSTPTVTLAVEGHLADLDRPRVMRWSDAQQQALFPGDRGCEFVEQLLERTIIPEAV